jgi:nickel transport protein
MKVGSRWLAAGCVWVCLLGAPGALMAQEPPGPGGSCSEIVTLLKEENGKLSGELRRIQREIAALRTDLEKPGIQEIFAGIGYILGLFGTAAFVASRRRKE